MKYSYLIYPLINLRGLCITFLIFSVVVLSVRRNENITFEEKLSCNQKFIDVGMTKREILEVTDRMVVEVCGHIPEYQVNTVWHLNRDKPSGVVERLAELDSCYAKFEDAGLTAADANEASDREVVELCETIPDLLELHRK